jgi:hypothetical protein
MILDPDPVGTPRPEEVGEDEPTERRQTPDVPGDGGLIPNQVDREKGGRKESRSGP